MNTTSILAIVRKLSSMTAVILVAAACGGTSGADGESRTPPQVDAVAAPATTVGVGQGGAQVEHDDASEHDDAVDDDEAAHDDGAAHDDHAGQDDDADHDDGVDHDDEVVEGADRVVEVSMTDLAFTPSVVDVVAGETIRFVVHNDGAIVHEFRLSNAHRIEEHLASGHDDHGEGGGHHGDTDVVLQLEAGDAGEVTVTFPEDVTFFTEIACLIPGHYEAGMKGTVTYE